MKIHIIGNDADHIKGYERVVVQDGKVNLDQYSDNECSLIFASDCLDYLAFQDMQHFLISARQKMRMGSKLVVGGTDLRLLSRSIVNGSIGIETANSMLYSKRSCADVSLVKDTLKDVGLNILTTVISGVHYEIEASR